MKYNLSIPEKKSITIVMEVNNSRLRTANLHVNHGLQFTFTPNHFRLHSHKSGCEAPKELHLDDVLYCMKC